MASARHGAALRHIHRLFGEGTLAGLPTPGSWNNTSATATSWPSRPWSSATEPW